MGKYTCAKCNNTYEKGWSDEEAENEYASNFKAAADSGEPRAMVCDDCYQAMRVVYEQSPIEQFYRFLQECKAAEAQKEADASIADELVPDADIRAGKG